MLITKEWFDKWKKTGSWAGFSWTVFNPDPGKVFEVVVLNEHYRNRSSSEREWVSKFVGADDEEPGLSWPEHSLELRLIDALAAQLFNPSGDASATPSSPGCHPSPDV